MTQTLHFPPWTGCSLLFCHLSVWFLQSKELCWHFLICILAGRCQICCSHLLRGMLSQDGGRVLVFVEKEMLQKQWSWVFCRLPQHQRWRENISLIEILGFPWSLNDLSSKPSVGMGVGIMRREPALQPESLPHCFDSVRGAATSVKTMSDVSSDFVCWQGDFCCCLLFM